MFLSTLDFLILGLYGVSLLAVALYVSREPKGETKDTDDYFLAGRQLPWWAIGASLIAANISAEQIIGMSGSGYVIGLAIASYEWMAAITLILVGKFLLPVFLKRQIYTMPQFLDQRYGGTVKITMSVFWLAVYTLVNLTAVLWLGALAVNTLTGLDYFWGMAALAAFAVAYSMYGGLKAVALTDIIQVIILIMGGLFIAYFTMKMIGGDQGIWGGFTRLHTELPGKFHMILDKSDPHYANLPGIGVLVGGMWIMNISYWGFNQYIIQRALAAKDIAEAQSGIAFAAFLKLLMPVIIVLPGIAAALLSMDSMHNVIDPAVLDPGLCTEALHVCGKPDRAYPEVMKLLPAGVRGLIFAALIAAITSSLASMMNSIATIFTMDIYKGFRPGRSEHHYVGVGRLAALGAMVIALMAAQPLLGKLDQAFQYIQEYTGFFTPGIVAIFLLGIFWKRTNAYGAMAAILGSLAFSIALKFLLPAMPFIDRVGWAFGLSVAAGIVISQITPPPHQDRSVHLGDISFATSQRYNLAAATVALVLIALYAYFW
ncbi:MAG: sodium transporter [Robiginitomaculum sp.]|nr:MAG: sodium transporter [Robiginitomaculum sp.]